MNANTTSNSPESIRISSVLAYIPVSLVIRSVRSMGFLCCTYEGKCGLSLATVAADSAGSSKPATETASVSNAPAPPELETMQVRRVRGSSCVARMREMSIISPREFTWATSYCWNKLL